MRSYKLDNTVTIAYLLDLVNQSSDVSILDVHGAAHLHVVTQALIVAPYALLCAFFFVIRAYLE